MADQPRDTFCGKTRREFLWQAGWRLCISSIDLDAIRRWILG